MKETTVGAALKNALYSNYIWKGEKVKTGTTCSQESKKMVDMTPNELRDAYKHCEKMLFNDDPKHLGRYNVMELVTEQINKCNIELLLRYFENVYKKTERPATQRYSLWLDLRKVMSNNSEVEDWSKVPISTITSNLPSEFQNINIADILDGCTLNLGAFNKEHLTMTFITKMGLWLTKAEENELKGDNNSNAEKLRLAKERLHLPSKLPLKFSENGLTYHEMRAMLTLPKKQRYSDMTTEQLITLSQKVLLRLQLQIDSHIKNWNKLKEQLKAVAKMKNIDLND